jgi:hypothetical protein
MHLYTGAFGLFVTDPENIKKLPEDAVRLSAALKDLHSINPFHRKFFSNIEKIAFEVVKKHPELDRMPALPFGNDFETVEGKKVWQILNEPLGAYILPFNSETPSESSAEHPGNELLGVMFMRENGERDRRIFLVESGWCCEIVRSLAHLAFG